MIFTLAASAAAAGSEARVDAKPGAHAPAVTRPSLRLIRRRVASSGSSLAYAVRHRHLGDRRQQHRVPPTRFSGSEPRLGSRLPDMGWLSVPVCRLSVASRSSGSGLNRTSRVISSVGNKTRDSFVEGDVAMDAAA
jgi:hypothetical protein